MIEIPFHNNLSTIISEINKNSNILNVYFGFEEFNGGRFKAENIKNIKKIIQDLNKNNIKNISLIFTKNNLIINDIYDKIIYILEYFKNFNINIITLEKYFEFFNSLKNKYELTIIKSITDFPDEYIFDKKYLIKNIKKFDFIVTRPEIFLKINDKYLLENLTKKTILLMDFDDKCLFCPLYNYHHHLASYSNIINDELIKQFDKCLLTEEYIKTIPYKFNEVLLKLKELNIHKNIHHFKIKGRYEDIKIIINNINLFKKRLKILYKGL